MARGSSQNRPVISDKGLVIQIDGHSIGGRILIGKTDIVFYRVPFFIGNLDLLQYSVEKRKVILGNREIKPDSTVRISHIALSLNEMFRKSRPEFAPGILMKQQHPFGLAPISKTLLGKELSCGILTVKHFRIIKREFADIVREHPHGLIGCFHSCKNIFKHSGRCPRCRNKLAFPLHFRIFGILNRFILFCRRQTGNPPPGCSRGNDIKRRKTGTESLYFRNSLAIHISIYEKLSSVLILCTNPLKASGSHSEHKIISENGIVVLNDRSYLTL